MATATKRRRVVNAASSGVSRRSNPAFNHRRTADYALAVGSEPNYPGGAAGSGGHVVFTFKAKKAGTGEVTLKYWRHFEGDKSITNRFRLRLHTRP
jgi:predicted secreted protein